MTTNINADDGVVSGVAGLKTSADNSGVLALQTNGTTAVTVDTSQNVGVATTTPSSFGKFGVRGAVTLATWGATSGHFSDAATGSLYITHSSNKVSLKTDADLELFCNNTGDAIIFSTNATERARIDTSGRLLLGQTGAGFSNSNSMTFQPPEGYAVMNHANGTGSGTNYFWFGYNGGSIGTISQNGTTAVAYNTSSDYRLKNTIAPMTGALAKVALLKPCTYKWNIDNSDGEGFIAHELAEVCPHAVTGEKDAVEIYTDEDGNKQTRPVYQGIDTSFLVATLTAAIQELKAEFDAYKASHP
jgi:hypothetical protein